MAEPTVSVKTKDRAEDPHSEDCDLVIDRLLLRNLPWV